MLPPSNLPSWWGFNQSILNEAKRLTLEGFPDLAEEAKDKIRTLSLESIPVESFSDTLVRTFAGGGYFPILEILDSNQPNSNHQAFTELGRLGVARIFITTNFDTLIEQSFRQAAVPLRVYIDEEDYRFPVPESGSCELYKIHGSVKSVSSLVDTVTQKLRGIPLQTRSLLATLFRNYHVLVLGYSGADLVFGDDYLTFSAISEDSPGITWLVRPGTQPSERVLQTVERAGDRGSIVVGDLPDFLENLGIAITHLPPVEASASSAEAYGKAQERIREFFAQEYVGIFSSAAFCVSLLRIVGDELTAEALCASLAGHPELTSDSVPIPAAIAFMTLAGWALQKHDFHQSIHWLNRDLGLHAGLARMYKENDRPIPPDVALEWNRNLAGIYGNLGLCFIQLGEIESARRAFDAARRNAQEAQDYESLSLVYMNMAQLEEAAGGNPDRILNLFRIARAFAQDAGAAQTIIQSNTMEAHTLMSIAEYDEASARLRQAEQYVNLFGGMESRLELNFALADLALRRGELDAAHRLFRESAALAEAQGSPIVADKIRFKFCLSLGFHTPFRQEIIGELNGLSERWQQSHDAGDVKAESIQRLLDLLLDEKNPFDKPAVRFAFQGKDDTESQVRMEIANCEFLKDLSPLPRCFKWLWHQKYEEGNADRTLDLANAFLVASERANDSVSRATAFNYLGISRDSLGDAKGALDAYVSALEIEGLSTDTRRTVKLHSALTLSKLNEIARAETTFNELIKDYQGNNDIDSVVHTMRALADHFARHERLHDAITQLETALTYCDGVERSGVKEIIRGRLNLLERRLKMGEKAGSQEEDIKLLLGWSGDAGNLDLKQLAGMRAKAKSPQELSNLAVMAACAGFTQEARSISEELLASFKETNNLFGLAGCLNNLGGISSTEGKLEQALEYSVHALEIFYRLEDIDMQILVQANIAAYSLAAGDNKKAQEYANLCLNLAEGRQPSRQVAVAWHVLAVVSHDDRKTDEMLRAAQGFIKTYAQIEAQDLEPIYDGYSRIVSEAERPTPVTERSPSEMAAGGREAMRLKEVGDYEGALRLLNDMAGRCQTTEESARVAGDMGNVFQSAGRHQEAVATYQRASELFRESELPDLATDIEIQSTVSMRLSGDASGAASTLRAMLQKLSATPQRVKALSALCNTLSYLVIEKGQLDEQTLDYINEAHSLFDEARAIDGMDIETLGSIEVNSATLSLLEGKPEDARKKLKIARQYFLRCNSQYLDAVENLIDQINGQSSDTEPDSK